MSEEELYEAKENAKAYFGDYLQIYLKAADDLGMSENYQLDEIQDMIDESGKKWLILKN